MCILWMGLISSKFHLVLFGYVDSHIMTLLCLSINTCTILGVHWSISNIVANAQIQIVKLSCHLNGLKAFDVKSFARTCTRRKSQKVVKRHICIKLNLKKQATMAYYPNVSGLRFSYISFIIIHFYCYLDCHACCFRMALTLFAMYYSFQFLQIWRTSSTLFLYNIRKMKDWLWFLFRVLESCWFCRVLMQKYGHFWVP
jgi:hypothetical protein